MFINKCKHYFRGTTGCLLSRVTQRRSLCGSPTHNIHQVASSGFSKENIQRYESGRPGYSDEVIERVVGIISSCVPVGSTGPSFCEIGAGTGKFTKPFMDTATKHFSGCSMLAVEPSDFKDHLRELNLRGVTVKGGTGEEIPAAASSVDAVLIAQAFHWMANIECLSDIHRILAPNHPLILVWNGYDTSVDWINDYESNIIIPRYPSPPGHVPRFQSMEWKNVFETPEAKQMFTPLITEFTTQTVVGDINMLINRALSTSVISNKPQAVHDEVEAEVRALVASHPALRDREEYELKYRTHVVRMKKI